MNHKDYDRRPSKFTLETILWVLIAVVALTMRLANLGALPLGLSEAHEAVLSWRAVNDQSLADQTTAASGYSPFLFAANALLFSLFEGGDGLARLGPAFFGVALTLTPLLLRNRLGRIGALVAGLCLAFSPTALVASRQLDGAIIAAFGVMICMGGLIRFVEANQRFWLVLSAVGLALGLTSSPSVYGILFPLLLATTLYALRFTLPLSRFELHISYFILIFIAAFLTLSTGLGWNPAGFGATGDLLARWFACFGTASESTVSPFVLLISYEQLTLLLGLVGLIWMIWRERRLGSMLGIWVGLGLLLLIVMPGREPFDLLWVILPLACLSGAALDAFLRDLEIREIWVGEVVYSLAVFIFWVYIYLRSARYAAFGDSADLLLVFLSFILQLLLGASFTLAIGFELALRDIASGTLIALLLFTLSVGWAAAYGDPVENCELLLPRPTAVGVRDLVYTLRNLSWRETGLPTTMEFTFVDPSDPVLSWYLRDFRAVRYVESIEAITGEGPVVAVDREPFVSDSPYLGQDFVLRWRWNPLEFNCSWQDGAINCKWLAKWLLFRERPRGAESSPSRVAEKWVTLWIRGASDELTQYP